ncbi:MAG: hypothetical protein OSJ68_06900, partial [Clostridia bacterium]|nr:hypothetical protein [Clostridia bacterium]
MTIEALNDKYFASYGDLFSNRSVLTEKQYDVMTKALLQQYLEELDVSVTERILEVGRDTFELKFKSKMYVPRRGFFGYNKIAKRLLKQYKAEFLTALQALENATKEEKEVRKELAEKQTEPPKEEST